MNPTADALLQEELGLTNKEVEFLNNRSIPLTRVAELAQTYKQTEQEHEQLAATRAEQCTERAFYTIYRHEVHREAVRFAKWVYLLVPFSLCAVAGGVLAYAVFAGLS